MADCTNASSVHQLTSS